jgi:hypothetical protein
LQHQKSTEDQAGHRFAAEVFIEIFGLQVQSQMLDQLVQVGLICLVICAFVEPLWVFLDEHGFIL